MAAAAVSQGWNRPVSSLEPLKKSEMSVALGGSSRREVVANIAVGAIQVVAGLTATAASIAILAGALVYLGLPAGTVAATTAATVAAVVAVRLAGALVVQVAQLAGTAIKS